MGLGRLEPRSTPNLAARDRNLAESVLFTAVTDTAIQSARHKMSIEAYYKLSTELYAPLPLHKFAVLRCAVAAAGHPGDRRPARPVLLATPPPLRERPPKRRRRA